MSKQQVRSRRELKIHSVRWRLKSFIEDWWHSQTRSRWLVALSSLSLAAGVMLVIAVAFAEQKRQSDQLLKKATKAFDLGELEKASLYFRKLVQSDSGGAAAEFGLALTLEEQSEHDRAAELMGALAPADAAGYPLAHWWLAQRLVSDDAQLDEHQALELEHHLQVVVDDEPRHAEAQSWLGRLDLARGQPVQAIAHFRRSVEQRPEDHVLLARAFTQKGDSQQAVGEARAAVKTLADQVLDDPEAVPQRIALSEALLLLRAYQQSESVLLDGLSLNRDPRLVNALVKLFVAAAQDVRRFAPADRIQLLERALQLSPRSPSLAAALANLLVRIRVPLSAPTLNIVQAHLEALPDSESAAASRSLVLGRIAVQQGQLEAGVAHFRSASQSEPAAWIDLARTLLRMEDREGAEAAAQAAVAHYQSLTDQEMSTTDRVELATGYSLLKNWEAAIQVLGQAEQESRTLDRMRSRVLTAQADEYASVDPPEPKRQVELLLQAVEADPQNREAYQRLARLIESDGAVGQLAQEALNSLLAGGKAPEMAHLILGTAAIRAEEYEQARVHLERAFDRMPNEPSLLNNLAWTLMRVEKPEPGRDLQLIERAVARQPDNPELLETRGEAYWRNAKPLQAVEDLERSLEAFPERVRLHRLLASAYADLGMTDLADKHRELAGAVE